VELHRSKDSKLFAHRFFVEHFQVQVAEFNPLKLINWAAFPLAIRDNAYQVLLIGRKISRRSKLVGGFQKHPGSIRTKKKLKLFHYIATFSNNIKRRK